MFKNKLKMKKTIIIPKPKEEIHNFKNNIKPNTNKNYENIRNIVENNEQEIQSNSNDKPIKNKFNIV